jgi:hypothetical protein
VGIKKKNMDKQIRINDTVLTLGESGKWVWFVGVLIQWMGSLLCLNLPLCFLTTISLIVAGLYNSNQLNESWRGYVGLNFLVALPALYFLPTCLLRPWHQTILWSFTLPTLIVYFTMNFLRCANIVAPLAIESLKKDKNQVVWKIKARTPILWLVIGSENKTARKQQRRRRVPC